MAVGKVVAASKALELLQSRVHSARRAQQSNATLFWPEFAEYDCFSCHHDLSDPSWRQQRGYAGGAAGRLPWGTWYFPVVPRLGKVFGRIENGQLDGEIRELSHVMGQPFPSIDEVDRCAKTLKSSLDALAEQLNAANFSSKHMRQLLLDLTSREGNRLIQTDWAATMQLYLTAAAAHSAYCDINGHVPPNLTKNDERIDASLTKIRNLLLFPKEFRSPKSEGLSAKARINEIQKQLSQIRQLLQTRSPEIR